MSRISRVTQQIFGGSASNNGEFGSAQAGTPTTSTNIASIMNTVSGAWAAGWLNAVMGASKFPPLEEFQGIDYVITTQLAYLFQQGIPEHDIGTTYYTNNIVVNPGTYQLFGSKTNANVGNALPTAPASNTNWQFLGDLSQITAKDFTGGTTTGTANAQILASTLPAGIALTDGYVLTLTAGATNTGALTLAITSPSISATAVKKNSGTGLVPLTGGEWVSGNQIEVVYNSAGTCWVLTNGIKIPNFYQAQPADPTGTTSTTGVMAGLAGALTPKNSGVIEIIISGTAGQSVGGSDTIGMQIRFGTGSAPSNGASLTGTAAGNKPTLEFGAGANPGFTCNAIIPGLTVGTAYWIDLDQVVTVGGTGNLFNISISAKEL